MPEASSSAFSGGVAAALGAAQEGKRVVLIEETDWLGGQFTSQGVSAFDEREYIEEFGGTRSYYRMREAIRDHYRSMAFNPDGLKPFNPGDCWVSRLAFEPATAVSIIQEMLAPFRQNGLVTVLLRTKMFSAETDGEKITSVIALNLEDKRKWKIRSPFYIDATELGDLLPLSRCLVPAFAGADLR